MIFFQKYILVLFFLIPVFSFGQKTDTKEYVKALFKNHSKIEWIKHYKGRIDDLNDISVTIGFDGKNCKGRMTYLRSGIQFDLVGTIKNRQIILQEFSDAQEQSGALEGKILGNTIIGNWKNYDGSTGGNFRLIETETEATFPSYCGDNKWIRKYKGYFAKDRIEIILQKESSEKLSGLIFYQKKNKTFTIKGNLDEYDNLEMKVKDQNLRTIQTIVGNLQQDQLTISTPDDARKTILTPSDGLTVGCVEYTDYMTGYDITFPKTTNAAFNKLVDDETTAWVKACKNHATKVKKQNTLNQPKMRSTERGYAWCEVDYFSKKMISGFMTFGNTWTPGQKLIAFNFDFEKNGLIYLDDIFDKKKDAQKFIRNYIKRAIKNHKLYSDKDFKKWIKKSDFSFFTIRKDGICFSTKFHRLYGRQSVTIPYQQLKPFLKKKFSMDN